MIRKACGSDYSTIIKILKEIQESGDSYFFLDMSDKDFIDYWIKESFNSFVYTDENDKVLGSYILGPIRSGRFSHIANASYIVSKESRGLGIGKKLAEHSLEFAKQSGYKAIQFTSVVSTNTSAVKAWQSAGFKIIGTVPKAFNHRMLGLVDTYIFYKEI